MPLPSAAKNLVLKKLDAFIAKRMKPQFADKIRLSYAFRGTRSRSGKTELLGPNA